MSRPLLPFLRPYLYPGFQTPSAPAAARAYRAVQRRFAQRLAPSASAGPSNAYDGPYDVEKQKRLDQLRKVKPLGEYHPRLRTTPNTQSLSVPDFNSKYGGIQETGADMVSVFGMAEKSTKTDGSLQCQEGSDRCGCLAPS